MMVLRYGVSAASWGGFVDEAFIDDGDLKAALTQAVLAQVGLDLDVTIGGVTMFLSAWLDPDHWSSDWAAKLGIDDDLVEDMVDRLLSSGIDEASR